MNVIIRIFWLGKFYFLFLYFHNAQYRKWTFWCACVCIFAYVFFWLNECVGSSAHTAVKYTHVESLSSRCLDSSHFHSCDGSKHQSVSHPSLQRGAIHLFVLCDSKPSFLPPHVLHSLPMSSVDLGLPFDPLPAWTCSPPMVSCLWT